MISDRHGRALHIGARVVLRGMIQGFRDEDTAGNVNVRLDAPYPPGCLPPGHPDNPGPDTKPFYSMLVVNAEQVEIEG